jgi:hypothetical protein
VRVGFQGSRWTGGEEKQVVATPDPEKNGFSMDRQDERLRRTCFREDPEKQRGFQKAARPR